MATSPRSTAVYAPLSAPQDTTPIPRSPRSASLRSASRASTDSSVSLHALEASEGFLNTTARRARANSAGSILAFDFQDDLLPLSLSQADGNPEPRTEKNIGLLDGIALVIGLQVGSGIFSSPGIVVANTQSVGASLIVWAVSGTLAWTGASSFAELGSMIPLNGGAQAYLAYAYNPLVSYLFTWTAITALKPGSNAIIALIFGEYINRLIYHATSSDDSPDAIPAWAIKLTACAAVVTVSLLCVASPKLGTRASVVFTVVKLSALLAIAILGVVQIARGRATASLTESVFAGTSTNPSSYALALYSGLWAFDGWDQTNYVGGEMKNPEKNIPRVIHWSMAVVMFLFITVNVSYFALLDKSIVERSNTVALDFGRAVFGSVGGVVFSCMVAFSCFGALNGSFFTSARLIYVAGREGFLPAMFGRLHSSLKTPINAMGLQASITIVYIIIGGGFRSLINFYSVASWLFYFLTVLGLVVLRFKEPNLERPYKTYITTPLIFSAVALFLLSMPIFAAPLEALAALAFISAGVPLYYITKRRNNSRDRLSSSDESPISNITKPFAACLSRVRRPQGTGWVAAETEERVEMLETHRRG
ncbi:hypothetical protein BOTBODRAFT_29449 [Botryobasidium botryosum FD-172 SS1]|uniref:Amino acid permease/ SLC12A domain-containing protein n=1 Tax=Botryobasidium botryosum (strain FD-172 SS1) TaxID=930990 RepID=A0A067N1T8_BOTB1|nr:hypothetical protein BOTBODRAFT_29449 [Botryobasidium botryosum FD-172 SS1]